MKSSSSGIDKEILIPFFIEHSSQPFATAGPDGKIFLSNKACCNMFGYTEEELIELDWAKDLTPPGWEKIESEKLAELHTYGKPVRYEKEFIHKDGYIIPVELLVHLIKNNSDNDICYYAFVTDLTERKLAEKKLQQSLIENAILMKELQHRVKNNLNIVASLIEIELEKLTDQKSKDIFINAKSRIHSISSIYKRLYTSGQIETIDLSVYIDDICKSLSETYIIDPSRIAISSKLKNIMIDTRKAVPLGLILNELVANAVKYAFPGNKSGIIEIGLKKENENVILSIMDNGIGLPENFTLENDSNMGLTLVNLLTEQIKGVLNISRFGGTGFTITFKL